MTAPLGKFQQHILSWYRKHGRHTLPWRPPLLKLRKDMTLDPYKILVSEIMLQQTQVDRVIPKYRSFLKAFPSVETLAAAKPREVLAVWHGLGYNRRALYLHRAAQAITRTFDGVFPQTVESLESLPGVGRYTARAIRVFAWNSTEIFLETNIRRVFIHFFFPDRRRVSDAAVTPFIQKALWKKDPRTWYWALMDYGALALRHVENPNRRSAHYTRQSPFRGSRRYVRAKIISLLLTHPRGMTVPAIVRAMDSDAALAPFRSPATLNALLDDLAREGFVHERRSCWKTL